MKSRKIGQLIRWWNPVGQRFFPGWSDYFNRMIWFEILIRGTRRAIVDIQWIILNEYGFVRDEPLRRWREMEGLAGSLAELSLSGIRIERSWWVVGYCIPCVEKKRQLINNRLNHRLFIPEIQGRSGRRIDGSFLEKANQSRISGQAASTPAVPALPREESELTARAAWNWGSKVSHFWK